MHCGPSCRGIESARCASCERGPGVRGGRFVPFAKFLLVGIRRLFRRVRRSGLRNHEYGLSDRRRCNCFAHAVDCRALWLGGLVPGRDHPRGIGRPRLAHRRSTRPACADRQLSTSPRVVRLLIDPDKLLKIFPTGPVGAAPGPGRSWLVRASTPCGIRSCPWRWEVRAPRCASGRACQCPVPRPASACCRTSQTEASPDRPWDRTPSTRRKRHRW